MPYALHDRDGYAAKARDRFAALGLELVSLHDAASPRRLLESIDGVFIGGGNTFRLLATLYAEELLEPIRRCALDGMPYMGTSAGRQCRRADDSDDQRHADRPAP